MNLVLNVVNPLLPGRSSFGVFRQQILRVNLNFTMRVGCRYGESRAPLLRVLFKYGEKGVLKIMCTRAESASLFLGTFGVSGYLFGLKQPKLCFLSMILMSLSCPSPMRCSL